VYTSPGTILEFGPYKGKNLEQVAYNYPEYFTALITYSFYYIIPNFLLCQFFLRGSYKVTDAFLFYQNNNALPIQLREVYQYRAVELNKNPISETNPILLKLTENLKSENFNLQVHEELIKGAEYYFSDTFSTTFIFDDTNNHLKHFATFRTNDLYKSASFNARIALFQSDVEKYSPSSEEGRIIKSQLKDWIMGRAKLNLTDLTRSKIDLEGFVLILKFIKIQTAHKEFMERTNAFTPIKTFWNCTICEGDQDTGCQYFDPTQCPRFA